MEEAVILADRVILIDDGLITLNVEIDLPRPRQRTSQQITEYVDYILKNILGKEMNDIQDYKTEKTKELRLVE